ncbi:MAG: carboxylating nicotinate-nucleotide diphosphorylase [Chitinophagales bacterium]|nr:carboxylating nicotinate-nucleotide diphosphorylase [Chitinophagales bacterium]
MRLIDHPDLRKFIQYALEEDVRDGDHTSLACIPKAASGHANLLIKEDGILCGLPVAIAVFAEVDSDLEMDIFMDEGDVMKKGDIAFKVSGSAISILTAERLVLNCMQRMSGIATLTNKYVQAIQGTNAKVIDTRKTTPGIRLLEKYAVTVGGGANHRMGLYDMIMIKDNHVDFSGGIAQAVERTHQYLKEKGLDLRIEVETRNIDEVRQVLEVGGVDRIMLDNYTPEDMKVAVHLINGRFETEASGGIKLDTIRSYAETGVDFISVGALTHSATSLDISLKAHFS